MGGHSKLKMRNAKCEIIVIAGPTATGKTALGVKLAKMIDGEVVSADSMQVYKHMDIGTAKPTAAEISGVPHHMIDILPPQEDYSVARYVIEASACIDDIIRRSKTPIVVGGSGLYIDSLIRGRDFSPRGNPAVRKTLEAQYDELGGAVMLEKLKKQDEKSASLLHENDKKRIVRALEVVETTGKTLSQHDAEEKELPPRYVAAKFALTYNDRAVLYDKINRRVDDMVAAGLVTEVSSLLSSGVPQTCTAMQAIGYKEIAEALCGKTDMVSAIAKVKQESTRYAKRQLTWLRRDTSIHWILWDNAPDIEYGAATVKELFYEAQ